MPTKSVMHCREETRLANVSTLIQSIRPLYTYFKPAHEKAIGCHLCIRVRPVLQQREDSPHNIHTRNHPRHWELGK